MSIEGLVQRRSFNRLVSNASSDPNNVVPRASFAVRHRTGKVIRSVTAAQNAFMHSRIDFTERVFFFISTRRRRRRRRRRCFLNFLYRIPPPVVFQSRFLFVPWRLLTSSLNCPSSTALRLTGTGTPRLLVSGTPSLRPKKKETAAEGGLLLLSCPF